MLWLTKEEGFSQINKLSKARTPFLFITSFEQDKIFAKPLEQLDGDIFYKLEDWRNYPLKKRTKDFTFSKSPVDGLSLLNILIHLIYCYVMCRPSTCPEGTLHRLEPHPMVHVPTPVM